MVESKEINEFQQINNKKESGIRAEDVQKYVQYLLLKMKRNFLIQKHWEIKM